MSTKNLIDELESWNAKLEGLILALELVGDELESNNSGHHNPDLRNSQVTLTRALWAHRSEFRKIIARIYCVEDEAYTAGAAGTT